MTASSYAQQWPPKGTVEEKIEASMFRDNWNCTKVTKIDYVGPDHFGQVYRVTCDVHDIKDRKTTIQYRVTENTAAKPGYKIEPWR
jgi:hypothetical protein